MPTYKLPPEEKEKDYDDMPETTGVDSYQRTVTIPVNDAILDELSVGDEVMVTLTGEITGLSKHESPDYESRNISVKITQVEAYSENDEEDNEKFKKGFDRGMGSNHRRY